MTIKRGDIYFIDLDPPEGHEYGSKRPVVVVNTDLVNRKSNFELRIVVPLARKRPKHEGNTWLVEIKQSPRNGLTRLSVADPYQIRCVSEKRFDLDIGKVGVLNDKKMSEIEDLIIALLDLDI